LNMEPSPRRLSNRALDRRCASLLDVRIVYGADLAKCDDYYAAFAFIVGLFCAAATKPRAILSVQRCVRLNSDGVEDAAIAFLLLFFSQFS
jgi:hypothetical protein